MNTAVLDAIPQPASAKLLKASIVRMGRQVAFMEAELFDAAGKLWTRVSSSAHVANFVPRSKGSAANG